MQLTDEHVYKLLDDASLKLQSTHPELKTHSPDGVDDKDVVFMNALLNSLTTEQRLSLLPEGYSAVKWVKFDVHDYDTKTVLSQNGIVFEKGHFYSNQEWLAKGVTHWCELPKLTKEK